MANLTQEAVNALLASVQTEGDGSSGGRGPAAKSTRTYDFHRPDKFSKDQLLVLRSIHEAFGRLAGARLSETLKFAPPMDIKLAEPTQVIWSGYQMELQEAGVSYLVEMRAPELTPEQPLGSTERESNRGKFLVSIDPPLLKGLVDKLLGGKGTIDTNHRAMPTDIESGLVLHNVIDILIHELGEAWKSITVISPYQATEAMDGPAMIRIVDDEYDVVTVLTLLVSYEVGRTSGDTPITATSTIAICYPHATLEPVLDKLSATTLVAKERSTANPEDRRNLTSTLQGVEVPVTALLGAVELTVDELASLKPGDVIRFAERSDHPIRLTVMNQAMAWATPGRVGDRVAVRLLTPLQQLMEA